MEAARGLQAMPSVYRPSLTLTVRSARRMCHAARVPPLRGRVTNPAVAESLNYKYEPLGGKGGGVAP